MLRITMNKSAAGAKKYYSEEYYSEGSSKQLDYYSDKNTAIGKWGGKAAEKLGLTGDISKEDFANLCDNINPETGKRLTGRNDADRTVGYDFTFNASKSVSLAYTFGSDEDRKAILQAFRESVDDTMKEIETGMLARVRGKGRDENRETRNIAYGEFVHFTTRPVDGVPDPHLHAHCFVFNATHDEQDGKWKAGQFRQIKQDAPYYEAYFHSQLVGKLQAAGYAIERAKNGFELAGVNKDTIEKFSRRTQEIEEHAREHNITDEKQKAQIGAKTREAKRANIGMGEQQAEWEKRLTHDEKLQFENLKTHSTGESIEANAGVKAIDLSLAHHLERKSVATDKEILATAIKLSLGSVAPEQVKKEFYGKKDIISVREDNRTLITTKAALSEEKELIARANAFKGKFRPINEGYRFKSGILNDQQKKAVSHALISTDGITIITGKAGTGKTTLMKEVKQGIEESGKIIFPFAPSSEASRVVQRSEGFENADTLASLIQNKARHSQLKDQVIWIDEAGQVSNKDMNKLLAIAQEQNARVILSGDTRQHNSVERGDALRVMQKFAGITPVTVSRIQRQKNAEYRQAVKSLSEGDIEAGFRKLEKAGAIREIADAKERLKAIADDYYSSAYSGRNKQSVLVIAPTHAEGDAVTSEIRERLKENRKISGEEKQFIILKSLQYTEAEKAQERNYRQGNILVFHQNIKGVQAGEKLEVHGYSNGGLNVRNGTGKEYLVPISACRAFNVFETRKIEIAAGDRIRITGNGKAMDGKHLFNGTSYTIAGFDRQGNIRLSNGSKLTKDYGQFAHAYVMTSHAAQGKTTDKIIVSQSSMSFRAGSMEQFYVSVSRGKQAAAIYTDDKAVLKQAVTQSVQRTSALELMARAEKMKLAVENNRLKSFAKLKERVGEVIGKLKPRNHELSGKNRTGKAE